MKKTLFVLYLLFYLACTNTHSRTHDGDLVTVTKSYDKEKATSVDTFHFLKDCNIMKHQYYVGAIQDTLADRDSAGYIVFFPCYTCKETYEVVFAYKGGKNARKVLGYNGVEKEYLEGCKDGFKKFENFAFVLPMRNPEKQKDLHAMNIDFPVKVKVYGQIERDNWRYIVQREFKTFNDYAAFQLAVVYHKIH
jgi:hypothetical protein